MRISDWSSDVCSSDLVDDLLLAAGNGLRRHLDAEVAARHHYGVRQGNELRQAVERRRLLDLGHDGGAVADQAARLGQVLRPLDEGEGDPVDTDRKSVVWGKSVSVSVDLGGRRIIKQTNKSVQYTRSR